MSDAVTHRDLTGKAMAIFPGSTIIHEDSYEMAKARMLDWIRSLKEWMEPVTRWALACEGAWESLKWPPPHCYWAEQLLETELTDVLAKMHAAKLASDFPSPYPPTWAGRPDYAVWEKMDPFRAKVFQASL